MYNRTNEKKVARLILNEAQADRAEAQAERAKFLADMAKYDDYNYFGSPLDDLYEEINGATEVVEDYGWNGGWDYNHQYADAVAEGAE